MNNLKDGPHFVRPARRSRREAEAIVARHHAFTLESVPKERSRLKQRTSIVGNDSRQSRRRKSSSCRSSTSARCAESAQDSANLWPLRRADLPPPHTISRLI